ncbi:MAG: hypothetical protein ACFFCD_04090 [Promethearchaeota archaeon]
MQKLKKYAVIFEAKPAVRLDPKAELKLTFKSNESGKETKVFINDILKSDEFGTSIHLGLKAKVEIWANTIDEAIQEAGNVTSGSISIASFTSGVGIPLIKEILAYEITPGIEQREFIQFFHEVPLPVLSRRELNLDHFLLIFNTLFKSFPLNARNRVLRAIRWYRMGVLEIDILNKFSHFWFGLECLNPLLRETLSAPDSFSECPKCGFQQKTPTITGVKELVIKHFDQGNSLYKKIRDLRNGLMHGFKDMQSLIQEAQEITPKVENSLSLGILILLGVNEPELSEIMKSSLANVIPIKAAIEANLHGEDPNKLGLGGEDPKFEITHVITKTEKQDGQLTVSIQSKLIPKLEPNVKVESYAWRLYGEKIFLTDVQAK